jgi:hypothetical protein
MKWDGRVYHFSTLLIDTKSIHLVCRSLEDAKVNSSLLNSAQLHHVSNFAFWEQKIRLPHSCICILTKGIYVDGQKGIRKYNGSRQAYGMPVEIEIGQRMESPFLPPSTTEEVARASMDLQYG